MATDDSQACRGPLVGARPHGADAPTTGSGRRSAPPPALVIAGMHRSGTSLVASLVAEHARLAGPGPLRGLDAKARRRVGQPRVMVPGVRAEGVALGRACPPPRRPLVVEAVAAAARALVEEKLAACGTIVPGARSIYAWEGKIEDVAEVMLLLKTEASLYAKLEKRLVKLHPYEVPEIIAWEPGAVHRPYAAWVAAALGEA